MVLLLTTTWLSASVDPYDLVVLEDPTNNTIVFRSTAPLSEVTEMLIVNEDGQHTYAQKLSANSYLSKRFTRRSLPNGDYTFVLRAETGKIEVTFTISEDNFSADILGARKMTYPEVKLRQARLLVVDYKNETGKRVNVRLTDAAGNEVFSEKITGPAIHRSYLLEQLEAGDYVVTVSSKNVKNYTAAIALN